MDIAARGPLATVLSFVAAWNANDIEAVVAHLHEDVFYHNVPVDPIHGRAAVSEYLHNIGKFDWVNWRVLAIAESGNRVLTERIDEFRLAGRNISLPLMGIFEVEQSLIRSWRDYFDMAMYRRQLTLPPAESPARSSP